MSCFCRTFGMNRQRPVLTQGRLCGQIDKQQPDSAVNCRTDCQNLNHISKCQELSTSGNIPSSIVNGQKLNRKGSSVLCGWSKTSGRAPTHLCQCRSDSILILSSHTLGCGSRSRLSPHKPVAKMRRASRVMRIAAARNSGAEWKM